MTIHLQPEVCILGGGPAGAAAALKLARLGHDVLVVERETFPRPHVGESLAPGIWQQLDLLDLADAVRAAGFPTTRSAIVRWGGPAETRQPPDGAPGLLVDRGRFDQLLLQSARETGARVLQPARALRPRRTGHGWSVPVLAAGKRFEVKTRYLVDATGRASRLGGRKLRTAAPTVALHASWHRPRGTWQETRVEAGPEAWFWGAPLPDGTFNAMAFLEAGRYRSRRRAGASRAALFRELLEGSVLLRDLLAGGLPSRVLACDATCRHDPEPIGEDFIKLGEAAFAIDPLSSSGVQVALRTAWIGSIAIHTALTRPSHAGAARRFYAESQEHSVRRHAGWAAAYHAKRPPAEERRGLLDPRCRVRLSRSAALVETPCISGDFIETRRALEHPRLERAVAYLDDVEIAPLIDVIPEEATLDGLAAAWSARMPSHQAFAIARWLVEQGVLVP